jgi:hypothetical protein
MAIMPDNASAIVYLVRNDRSNTPTVYKLCYAFATQKSIIDTITAKGQYSQCFHFIENGTLNDTRHLMMHLIYKFGDKIKARNPTVLYDGLASDFYGECENACKYWFGTWQTAKVPTDDEIHGIIPEPVKLPEIIPEPVKLPEIIPEPVKLPEIMTESLTLTTSDVQKATDLPVSQQIKDFIKGLRQAGKDMPSIKSITVHKNGELTYTLN